MTKQTRQGPIIVWFRQDLRIQDNPALTFASDNADIIPVFINDESAPDYAQLGAASKWWLHHSLLSLNKDLANKLLVLSGDAKAQLDKLASDVDAQAIVWNRCYEPWQRERDEHIKNHFKAMGVSARSFNGSLLWEPMQVLKKDGTPYKVFTPYYRKGCLQRDNPRFPLAKPQNIEIFDGSKIYQQYTGEQGVEQLTLLPNIVWYEHINTMWSPGERGAADRLSRFISEAATSYQNDRNLPAVKGTSLLSPHLHFGEVSPNQVWFAILGAFDNAFDHKDLDVYLSELGWREFSYYLLYHWPDINQKNFNSKFDHFPWRDSAKDLKAWQFGNTGIPIVDAGMRELYKTGYMHNRVRMIVGSFLVKNLLIDWREGERWFWDCLVDADLASNSSGWQWVAGSGADASPYFRVFNPLLQGEKFDKEGEYVKTYCPELSKLPKKFIHQPWAADSNILKACGIELGKTYPKPIVDLKASRQRALDAFSKMKEADV
ncbi:deoxyribodipyrimidine photo-lyase [Glaciecola sp. MH2013]|uniref:cryptochrome/photolyase family protein n=1 Tax=Glaciecola sp. MH2013 TaxID=2785524 RepID=UPI00189EF4B9|nr:deoxyribodipyrimidine photo-lyase [Glaciecola sp. MH2013]MBF7072807.1 deoxyribodipyrimidine photo-lyase [Glaciecola sp. MH2013]